MKDIGLYGEFYDYPLKHAETKADIDNYPFPYPYANGRFRVAKQNIVKYKPDYGVGMISAPSRA